MTPLTASVHSHPARLAVEIAAEQIRYMQGQGLTNMEIAAAVEWLPYLWPEFIDLVERYSREWIKLGTEKRRAA